MKIAQVCPRYSPHIGGVETFVKKISEEFVRKQVEVEVLCEDPDNNYVVKSEIINGVSVKRFKARQIMPGVNFSNEIRLYLKENSSQYDLIHAHSYHAFPALYAAWGKGENKLVVNAHYHGKGSTSLTTLLHFPYRFIGKTIFEKADILICHTEFEKRLVQTHFSVPDSKIALIPSGVDVAGIANAIGFAKTGKLLLCVGRIEKYKNMHIAIKVMTYLPEDYRLIIIGNGPYKPMLQNLIRGYNMADRIQIFSGLTNEEVFSWYKTCDLVLNLSEQEAFGLTVIEGLAAKKKVLVNKSMALEDLAMGLTGVTAIDVKRLSIKQIAMQVDNQILHRDESVADVSEYSWDIISNKILDLYKSIIKS